MRANGPLLIEEDFGGTCGGVGRVGQCEGCRLAVEGHLGRDAGYGLRIRARQRLDLKDTHARSQHAQRTCRNQRTWGCCQREWFSILA